MKYKDINNKFNKDYCDIETSVNNALFNLFNTYPGDIPGHPEYGSKVKDYLFSLIDPLSEQLMSEAITYAIIRWEPRIEIKSINFNNDPDYNRVTIKLNYILIEDPYNREKEFIYNYIIN